MITPVVKNDLPYIVDLIESSIRECIDVSSAISDQLIEETINETLRWLENNQHGVHLSYKENGVIVGVILIKEYWNMTGLFVRPSCHGKGIASKLTDQALALCKDKSPIGKVRLNSSLFASGFYAKFGFKNVGTSRELPGGCIPYEYCF